MHDALSTLPLYRQPFMTLAKLAQRFAWGRLALSVNNLLDRSYFAYAVNSNFTDLANVYPQPGRAVYLTAEVRLPE